MSGKRRREKPTLDGVLAKIERAERHMESLERDLERVFPKQRYVVAPEISDDGLRHVFRTDSPPPVPPEWSLMVGDLIHNLRTALDHLAYQLVLACHSSPNRRTQFPIQTNKRPALPTISGGVSSHVRNVLDLVQPYYEPDRNHGLDLLRDLDNIDKHRRLVVVVATTRSSVSTAWGGAPDEPPPLMLFTHHPIQDSEVIAVVTCERPRFQPDPTLFFIPDMAFAERGSVTLQDPLRIVVGDLIYLVRDEVVPKFEQFFP